MSDISAVIKAVESLEANLTKFSEKAEAEIKAAGSASADTKAAIDGLSIKQRELAEELLRAGRKLRVAGVERELRAHVAIGLARDDAASDILRTLEALELHWDGEVVYQSRRSELYRQLRQRTGGPGHFPMIALLMHPGYAGLPK